ncbi:thioesterase family protein [Actinoallomurus sp. NBC_01490]|uniref:hotdog domain-containing protein n=1 Tax=Actinoallomurus sp. NBC_01490 TaxID=2903557 RepID=UPI002E352C2E|nr:hotdog domain-containing protein [Actinoallomurus sp. NBC_01490]
MGDDEAAALLARLHAAQNDFYGGGGDVALREVLSPDVSWHVPGDNAIAGHYEGIESVLAYFAGRRDLAGRTFRMRPRDLLAGRGEWVASLTDGEAVLGGRRVSWSTVGLYRLSGGRVAECRLLPLDPAAFDAVWAGPAADRADVRGAPEDGRAATPTGSGTTSPASTTGPGHLPTAAASAVSAFRVRPRHCDAQGVVYAGRYHEFFEDAFLDWLDEHAGGYAALRDEGVDMVIVSSACDHRRPARLGDPLTVETRPERAGRTSLTMAFTVRGPAGPVAEGRITYVAVGRAGAATGLPEALAGVAGAADRGR